MTETVQRVARRAPLTPTHRHTRYPPGSPGTRPRPALRSRAGPSRHAHGALRPILTAGAMCGTGATSRPVRGQAAEPPGPPPGAGTTRRPSPFGTRSQHTCQSNTVMRLHAVHILMRPDHAVALARACAATFFRLFREFQDLSAIDVVLQAGTTAMPRTRMGQSWTPGSMAGLHILPVWNWFWPGSVMPHSPQPCVEACAGWVPLVTTCQLRKDGKPATPCTANQCQPHSCGQSACSPCLAQGMASAWGTLGDSVLKFRRCGGLGAGEKCGQHPHARADQLGTGHKATTPSPGAPRCLIGCACFLHRRLLHIKGGWSCTWGVSSNAIDKT